MRVMLATFGVGMVPLGWYTPVQLDMSQWACHLVARMALFALKWSDYLLRLWVEFTPRVKFGDPKMPVVTISVATTLECVNILSDREIDIFQSKCCNPVRRDFTKDVENLCASFNKFKDRHSVLVQV
ncbi:hypothetical protein C8R43DRAFT_1193500 [Mycena crocata]|nr:hypothetical protein C8R43DRAFT_966136 [Mycena crocata]KAJ7177509.1 hypothetical protein C8R43DRAFT_1193500 [Mycena crocata]